MSDEELTYSIIGSAMRVHRELGSGLREKPYENALVFDFKENGIRCLQQPAYTILYHGHVVGVCFPDLTVENRVVAEIKAIDCIGENESAQMLNYLRVSGLKVGLILNFKNAKLEMKRHVY